MTPAVTLAEKHKLPFVLHEYTHQAEVTAYGEEAASKLGVAPERVFKTLVVSNSDGEMAVAILPVSSMLNMKVMAKALDWKKVMMANKQSVMRCTGYVLGGVSPLGQKKKLPTVIDASCNKFDTIYVSAGKRGLEIELAPFDLCTILQARVANMLA